MRRTAFEDTAIHCDAPDFRHGPRDIYQVFDYVVENDAIKGITGKWVVDMVEVRNYIGVRPP